VAGTGALALIGIRLPRIEFFNQRIEAAYRKELVLGEDDPTRADPPTVRELFSDIRCNYFRLYLNFMYFNIGRSFICRPTSFFRTRCSRRRSYPAGSRSAR
jgi:peptide/bleomycin uptake transporter